MSSVECFFNLSFYVLTAVGIQSYEITCNCGMCNDFALYVLTGAVSLSHGISDEYEFDVVLTVHRRLCPSSEAREYYTSGCCLSYLVL
jgi:hypothetical protein